MSEQRPLIQIQNDLSIRFGKIWVQGKHLSQALSPYSRLVFCLTGLDGHPYSFRGSATALRWRGEHFVFYCKHQISGFAPSAVVFPADKGGKILVSGSKYLEVIPDEANADEEFGDLCGVYFNPQDYMSPNIGRGFFDLNSADLWNGDRDAKFIIYGYPTSLRDLEYADPSYALSHIHVLQVVTTANYVRASHAKDVHVINMRRTDSYSSDGLSGGAVFHLAKDAQGFYCGFAGIILRGSETSNLLHFLDARFILQFLRRQINSEQGGLI